MNLKFLIINLFFYTYSIFFNPADIWSVGIIIFALLAGSPPYTVNVFEILVQKIKMPEYKCPDYFSINGI
jgi:serine/threonine protein kinase